MIRENVSLVIPAKNEAAGLQRLLPRLLEHVRAEQIHLVDDGSTDATAQVARQHGVRLISHPYSMGNGAAIKSGARHATGELLLFMDADGQHDPADIPRLLEKLDEGYDMVVGARDAHSQASWGRGLANRLYNRIASYMTGQRVDDLTSGFRLVRARRFREFMHLLPNGFSYPTTSTMAFFRAGYPVGYLPIHAAARVGKSHIRPLHDGLRFLLIIFKVGTLYSPLKLFAPLAIAHFMLGAGYYLFTFLTQHRLSNMSVFMFTAAVTIFLIGLVSEQITQLLYQPRERDG
ncbi:MAG TPA: glycosyltransferase family 2 protein [Pseudomonadales bacterium]|jgi:glycosyltransferase involved in cell wall biosynthesis|nr:glycosyltransferase family 2 protein [Pseudomonadales bacterium]HQN41670.1 glycosyltransferase family 2 protein [Pseudomonadales bacterium]